MTAVQLSWTDEVPPMVRRSDPATSRVAAKSVDVRPRQRECLTALAALGGIGTADDVAIELARRGLARPQNGVSKRLGELVGLGRVRRAGVSLGRSGRQQTLWGLVR